MKNVSGQVAGTALIALLSLLWAEPLPSAADDFVECKIQQRPRIEFPVRALAEGVMRGEAVLMLDVNRTGQLGDLLIVAYTQREFATSAVEAVKQWQFTPGRIAGETVGARITLVVEFEVTGVLAYVKPIAFDAQSEQFGERYVHRPMAVELLDRLPVALVRTAPIYPKEWIVQGRAGVVTIDFFIDEQGRVRFPSVLGQADGMLGAAAVAAMREWRFEPPTAKGRPVLVRAEQVFDFQLPTPAEVSAR